MLAGNHVKFKPAAAAVHNALGAQHSAVFARIQRGERRLQRFAAVLVGRFMAPACEDFVRIVVMVVAAAADAMFVIVMDMALFMVVMVAAMAFLLLIFVMAVALLVVVMVAAVAFLLLAFVMAMTFLIVMVMAAMAFFMVVVAVSAMVVMLLASLALPVRLRIRQEAWLTWSS